MSRGLIEIGNLNVELTPRPIAPSWIIEGKPAASACTLSQSADGTATTIVWYCTEGKFNWYYDFDETILILEGSIVLENENLGPTRYGPGAVIFFKDGAHAKWHVEGHVKKLAFCRKTQPVWLGFAIRVIGKIKRMFIPAAGQKAARLMGAS
ncbi:cupin domain-containing protein [Bradyrhizobium sp. Tv2a-2]|uniref:cupin domain-containing protein n=1 Tax=Bradyrhizobium sp. Tv2a-2 TaxID=113395 RepID=UPI00040C7115|nr:cupin domain-containing protein [Bradyrhizobium sp. Tv2a-2]